MPDLQGGLVTALKCQRCQRYWTVSTQFPDTFHVIGRFCPDCIPVVLPELGQMPIPRRTA